MIWALIITLIIGGSEPLFFVPKFNNYVKKYVEDSQRIESILKFRKETKKNRKEFRKQHEKRMKCLLKMNKSRQISRKEMEEYITEIMILREKLQDREIEIRMEAQKYIMYEEWQLIMADSDEGLQKSIKNEHKQLKKLIKNFEKFENELRKIPDSKRREASVNSIILFKGTSIELYKNYIDYLSSKESILLEYKVSEDDLQDIRKTVNGWRMEVFEAFMDTHFVLVENTTESEWNSIIRRMNNIF